MKNKDSVIPEKLRQKIWKKANKIHKDNRAFFEWYLNNADSLSKFPNDAIEQWFLVVLLINVAFDEGKEYELNNPRDLSGFIDQVLYKLEFKDKTQPPQEQTGNFIKNEGFEVSADGWKK